MINVAITGLHRGNNPQPGAAVAAGLRRRFPDLRIVGLSYDPLESGLYCHDGGRPDVAYLMPFPGAGAKATLDRLDEILQTEPIDYLIPCLDSELDNYIQLQPELKSRGIGCLLPSQQALDDRAKSNLDAFCGQLEVPTPRTLMANDPDTLAALALQLGYPVYVKGRFYEAHLATTPKELYEAFASIASVWGTPVLVQEMVVGEEYDILGLGDGEGGLLASCSIRKMLRTSAGKGFAGVVVADPDLDELVARVIGALRWAGPFELEFIKVPGKPHALFEMNPRFPAWVDFPSQIGCNMPARLLEQLIGLDATPLQTCTPGQMFIRHSIDLVADIAEVAEMTITGRRSCTPNDCPTISR
ncbi:carbamoyl-phosphate-synthetase [Stutzerimonas stutzeri]|uniref:carbamoyl-phosphate-synthetase n=1 Tax=Stutzerimonas stutzeri TaxID=316 RepID=UPI00177F931D|nr:carbamoyl-phosphate-synthetase [Stutzerimonas stutzeri]MBD9409555.1 carbamoyl-phosphate-synthetase [Stutzerimonas stutzeri]